MKSLADAVTPDRPEFPSWRRLTLIALLYTGVAIGATFPAITTIRTALPGHPADPLVHLWTMRWYKQCLMEGNLPFLAPGLQHPVGAPVGYLPPLQYQSLLYLGLSSLLSNDVLCFNIIWFLGFVLTGFGTYILAWYVLRHCWAATLAGLLAMLAGPISYFAVGEIEQITLGWFPLFMVGWLRFVDQPSRGRLVLAAALYLLLAMSAPYYGLFGVFPATLYVLWSAWSHGWRVRKPFILPRLGWFIAFVGLTFPALLVLFSSQVWAMTHGFPMDRSSGEFQFYKASLGGYLIPIAPKLLAGWLQKPGSVLLGEAFFPAYLGIVTLGLLAYTAVARVRFPRASFWWLGLAMLVILSLGASITIGNTELPLPAQWLREYIKILKPVRVPARFAYFAALLAVLIAAAGFRHLLTRIPNAIGRAGLALLVMSVALVDLAHVPFPTRTVPEMPRAYQWIKERSPNAALFEAPHSNFAWRMPALCTYWQSFHGLRTSAGYTADLNPVHEPLITHSSPFHAHRLADPEYLKASDTIVFEPIGLTGSQKFNDYVWLYLKSFGFDYLVLHHRPGDYPELPVQFDQIKHRLAPAKVFEDEVTAVYETELLPVPSRPTLLCGRGWRGYIPSRFGVGRLIDPVSEVTLYNPNAGEPIVLALRGTTRRAARILELRDGNSVLARWRIEAGDQRTIVSPPLDLAEGLHRLTLVCDGVEPDTSHKPHFEKEQAPYGLWVSALGFGASQDLAVTWDASEVILAEQPIIDRVVR
ncbi:hypothetical protein [Tautonia rosea]|uniref:hypothetical protein n=1 Tax=Tautonia rosea TaxID=2728037 RepID=UPI001475D9B2|nr:hypothetical protein [Tautonia rosea]